MQVTVRITSANKNALADVRLTSLSSVRNVSERVPLAENVVVKLTWPRGSRPGGRKPKSVNSMTVPEMRAELERGGVPRADLCDKSIRKAGFAQRLVTFREQAAAESLGASRAEHGACERPRAVVVSVFRGPGSVLGGRPQALAALIQRTGGGHWDVVTPLVMRRIRLDKFCDLDAVGLLDWRTLGGGAIGFAFRDEAAMAAELVRLQGDSNAEWSADSAQARGEGTSTVTRTASDVEATLRRELEAANAKALAAEAKAARAAAIEAELKATKDAVTQAGKNADLLTKSVAAKDKQIERLSKKQPTPIVSLSAKQLAELRDHARAGAAEGAEVAAVAVARGGAACDSPAPPKSSGRKRRRSQLATSTDDGVEDLPAGRDALQPALDASMKHASKLADALADMASRERELQRYRDGLQHEALLAAIGVAVRPAAAVAPAPGDRDGLVVAERDANEILRRHGHWSGVVNLAKNATVDELRELLVGFTRLDDRCVVRAALLAAGATGLAQ